MIDNILNAADLNYDIDLDSLEFDAEESFNDLFNEEIKMFDNYDDC